MAKPTPPTGLAEPGAGSGRAPRVVAVRPLPTDDTGRMERLLEVMQAATSSLDLERTLAIAVERMGEVIPADRCSVVLVERAGDPHARVVAAHNVPGFTPLTIELARYPELRRALEERCPVYVEDALADPLMVEVRHHLQPLGIRGILVHPLVQDGEVLGALSVRLLRGAVVEERDRAFVEGVAAALANCVRNARLHTALRRKREQLEGAYVDRYRELADANRRLRELNRLKDEFIAVCSHDLRSPLQIVLGHARLLQGTRLSGAQQASVGAIHRQSGKIIQLVESLLERGSADAGQLSIDPRPLELGQLVAEVAAEFQVLAREREISVAVDVGTGLGVIGDELKLREVLQNLLTNALSHARTRVLVRADRLLRPDGQVVRVLVEDDGPGIPPERLHGVFDRYKHGGTGTGLGLAICREFIELHGGETWAESELGAWARFQLTLPVATEARAAAPVERPSQGKETPRVLVLEDEPETASTVSRTLRGRYRVEVIRDGREGLARARSLVPDVILLDAILPGMDGLDVVKSLRASADTASIPVVLLSSHPMAPEQLEALQLGAGVDFQGKPFQPAELLARVERALQLREVARELERSRLLLRHAGRDPATGQLDREGLAGRVEEEFARAHRHARVLTLVRYALPTLEPAPAAAVLRQNLRAHDVVAHLGDGLFALALPETALPAAEILCRRLHRRLEPGPTGNFRALDAMAFPTAGQALVALLGENPEG
jgi:two-component system sensor histidine kinase ChiS